MRFAEAGQPVCVPGVSHQQLRRPDCDHSAESCSDHIQDLREAHPAEDKREGTLEERHPGGENQISRLFDTRPALPVAVHTMRNVETCRKTNRSNP